MNNSDSSNKKKKDLLITGITFLVIVLLGSTYAFFTYSRSSQAFTLTSNGISAEFTEGTHEINFQNAYPISDEFAIENLDKLTYVDFTVSGDVANPDEAITYEIYLTEKSGNTLSSDYIKVYLTDENDNQVSGPSIYSSLTNTTYANDANTGKLVFKNTQTGTFSKDYRLYVWLDQNYSQNSVSQTFSFYVNLYAYNDNAPEKAAVTLTKKINSLKADNPSCNYTVEDYNTDEELEATYLSGPATGNCAIDFNYVWWSGKMWRITAIYPDGAIKMITDNNITSIAFNPSNQVNYYTKADPENEIAEAKSFAFQFLNEDFLDTLYNQGSDVIDTTKYWNATKNTTSSNKPAEAEATMIPTTTSPIGLLNNYEYYKSYQNTTYGNGYLNIGYYWWLLNPYNSSDVWFVYNDGYSYHDFTAESIGVRPSIIIKAEISMSGVGTKENPYRLSYDYDSVNTNDLLNIRYSGEYIKFASDGNNGNYDAAPLFRIVGVEGSGNSKITKIVSMDYATYDNSGTPANTKMFASTVNFGADGNTESNEYWDYYLNNDWYDNLSFKSSIVSGTFYIGDVERAWNYKLAVCKTASSDTTKVCLGNAEKRVTTAFTGNVGLLRYGEMFSTQEGNGYSSSIPMLLITKSGLLTVWRINNDGKVFSSSYDYPYGARPSLYLKSTVKILSGSGTELDPYVVGL